MKTKVFVVEHVVHGANPQTASERRWHAGTSALNLMGARRIGS